MEEPTTVNPIIDYASCKSHFAGARYIIECCTKLKANTLTVATAATYFHRFYQSVSLDDYDPYLISCTCIYLASKVEDDDIKIRDIINVGLNCIRRDSPPLSLDPYFALRDSLVQAELLLMRVLGFKLKIDLPHKYLLFYISSLKEWVGESIFETTPIVELSWTILQDVYHSSIVLKKSPQLLAASVLFAVTHFYGIVVPGSDDLPSDRQWYTVLHPDCTLKEVWAVMYDILNIYKDDVTLVTKDS